MVFALLRLRLAAYYSIDCFIQCPDGRLYSRIEQPPVFQKFCFCFSAARRSHPDGQLRTYFPEDRISGESRLHGLELHR